MASKPKRPLWHSLGSPVVLGLIFALLELPALATSLLAWRINRQGTLELRTALDNKLSVFYQDGVEDKGPTIYIDFPGPHKNSNSRTLRGSGSIREVRISSPSRNATRFVIEFAPGTQIDRSRLRLIGTARDRWQMDLSSIGNPPGLAIGEGNVSDSGISEARYSTTEGPSSCDSTIQSVVRDIDQRGAKVKTSYRPQGGNSGRTRDMSIVVGVEQFDPKGSGVARNIMASPVLMKSYALRIFESCSNLKSVGFGLYATDWWESFLMSEDGRLGYRKCSDSPNDFRNESLLTNIEYTRLDGHCGYVVPRF